MSIKVPQESVQYQSHNNCQCDFCSSRRAVNAKKLSVSKRAAQLQHAKQRNGCCCQCHDAVNATTFAASRSGGNTTFDPEYPAPVNQTALNASRGRTGAANGQTTMSTAGANNSSRAAAPAAQTKEEEEKAAMAELDGLERLLILEHKARVQAALEADRLGTLRNGGTASSIRAGGPQPLPAGYTFANSQSQGSQQRSFNGSNSNYRSGDAMFDGADAQTIREAYALAHECPVTPPAQCRASHRLQDTLQDVRAVTMDPVNPAGRDAIQQMLHANGLAPTPLASASGSQRPLNGSGSGTAEKEFGGSLAKNRTSHAHPQGAGLVWVNGQKRTAVNPGDGSQIAATQFQTQQQEQLADGTRVTTTTKKVTYAV